MSVKQWPHALKGPVSESLLSISRGVKLTAELKKSTPGGGKMKDFTTHLMQQREGGELKRLRDEVAEFASAFPMPGL